MRSSLIHFACTDLWDSYRDFVTETCRQNGPWPTNDCATGNNRQNRNHCRLGPRDHHPCIHSVRATSGDAPGTEFHQEGIYSLPFSYNYVSIE